MAISQESPTEVTAMAVNDEKTTLSPSCVLGVDIKHLLQLAKACVIIRLSRSSRSNVDAVFFLIYITYPRFLDVLRFDGVYEGRWEGFSRSPNASYKRYSIAIAINKRLFELLLLPLCLAEDPLALAQYSDHEALLIHIVRVRCLCSSRLF